MSFTNFDRHRPTVQPILENSPNTAADADNNSASGEPTGEARGRGDEGGVEWH